MDVTVVIPCFNESPENLRRAVASAVAPSAEVIVVDDGSTRGETLTALDSLNVQVIHTPNGGPARARNVGIGEGSGTYVLCLDSDDYLGEGFIGSLTAHLRGHPETTIAFSEWQRFGADTDLVVPESEIEWSQMLRQCPINNSSMFRRSDWRQLGGYDESLRVGYEDWEWWCRLLLNTGGRARIVDGARYYYQCQQSSRQIDNSRGVEALRATRHAMMSNNPDHASAIALAVIEADLAAAYLWGTLQSPIADAATSQARYWAGRYGRVEALLNRFMRVGRLWDRFVTKPPQTS
ncbi:MAG TPA: glycosyltransferase family A protein [Arachnia sp.]|nr:glycosyltransferase family A protein [Arachnia sp.]